MSIHEEESDRLDLHDAWKQSDESRQRDRRDLEDFESSKDIYSQEDIQGWQEGAKDFHRFWKKLSFPEQSTLMRDNSVIEFRLMFLGEKPVIFQDYSAKHITPDHRQDFEAIGPYLFRPDLVEHKYKQYEQFFRERGFSSGVQALEAVSKANREDLKAVRGLLLGYPLEAVLGNERGGKISGLATKLLKLLENSPEEYNFLYHTFFGNREGNEEAITTFLRENFSKYSSELYISEDDIPGLMEELRFILTGKSYRVGSYGWVGYEDSPESVKLLKRLAAALRESVI